MVLRPVQRPHPPLWYGMTIPDNADWPAAERRQHRALGPRDDLARHLRSLSRRRAPARQGPDARSIGVGRHVVVADTDAEALAIARRAYPRWRDSFRWLFERHGAEPRIDRHLSGDIRRAAGDRQRHCRFAADRARFHQGGNRGDGAELFRVLARVRRHDARGIAALGRAAVARS